MFSAAACSSGSASYEILLNRTDAGLEEGESVQLTATVEQDGKEVEADVEWKSSDNAVATVSDGDVTAVTAGSAVITAEYKGAEAACVITVTKYYQPQLRISLNYSDLRFTQAGQTETLIAQTTLGEEAADISVSFSSENTEVAKVSRNGLVTAVAEGETQIVARAESDGRYAESVCRVSVQPYAESVIYETDQQAYIYSRDDSRNDSIEFGEEVLAVRDRQTGNLLPYRVQDGAVTVLSDGSLSGERRIEIEGVSKTLIVTGVFVTYEVSSAEELVARVKGDTDDYIVLTRDIDMSDYLKEHPWNSTDMNSGAFFNFSFSGTLDGQGHSILNLNSTAGVIERNLNTVFKELSSEGTIKNLHLQVSIGLKASYEGARRALLIGDMYGTIENCFFDINAQFDVDWFMYGAAAFYNLSETACVRNTVFYIPTPSALRMICATAWGADFEGMGTFENVAYVYGSPNINGALPAKLNPDIRDIYCITASGTTGTFTDPKALNAEKYAAAPADKTNDASYWDDTTLEAITEAMDGFTFTEKQLWFGDTLVADNTRTIEISDAEGLVAGIRNKPWGNFILTQDIDMSGYLEENPWNWTDVRAFFDITFTGTLDGQGHSVLNLNASAGVIDRWENVVIREVGPTGVIKNLHMEVSLGVKAGGYDRALLFGNMYGTVENCFFELDVETSEAADQLHGIGVFYRLDTTSVVRDTAFYIPNGGNFRLMCATTGDASWKGTFENIAFIYNDFNYDILLQERVNPAVSDVYLIRQNEGAFTDAKVLSDAYATGSTVNGAALWEGTTLETITAAMKGFTFTDKKLMFGDTVVADLTE